MEQIKYYGAHKANEGKPYDPKKCAYEVFNYYYAYQGSQCGNKPKKGEEYCAKHNY